VNSLYVISGIADNITVIDNVLNMTVAHTTPSTVAGKESRMSVFEVEANNGTAKWADELPLVNGTPVTVFAYRLQPMEEVFDGEQSVWLKVYARDVIIRDPDSREVTTGVAIGRVGQDAETKFLPTGQSLTNVSIATDFGIWNAAENKWDNETTWLRCTIFGNKPDSTKETDRAMTAGNKLLKGTLVEVVLNDLHASKWPDKEGNIRLSVDVIAGSFSVLKEPSASSTPQPALPPQARKAAAAAAAAAQAATTAPATAAQDDAPDAAAQDDAPPAPPVGRKF
jgi:single-strand DNA-binding protein